MLQEMSLLDLIEYRSQLQGCHTMTLRSGDVRMQMRVLNRLRVVNAEIVVAQSERR
jgi:hypothetical protein